jgi:long-chain acyl-CoA synthetase
VDDRRPEPDGRRAEKVHASPADQVAALIYTTGTTGNPKGVMLTHRNLLFIAAVSSTLRGLTPGDRAYGVLPITHVYGLASVMLGTLYAGACLPVPALHAGRAAQGDPRRPGLTIVQGVPAMYARLLETLGGGGNAAGVATALRLRRRFAARRRPSRREVEKAARPAAAQRLRPDRSLAHRQPDPPRPAAQRHLGRPGDSRRRSAWSTATASTPPGANRRAMGARPERHARLLPGTGADGGGMRPGGWLNTGDVARRTTMARCSSSAAPRN